MSDPTPKALPPRDYLQRIFEYQSETGFLIWKPRPESDFSGKTFTAQRISRSWNVKHAGKFAFRKEKTGYIRGKLDGRLYLAHRIIWKIVVGTEPHELDHINGDRSDNRIENLRPVDRRDNMRNSGLRSNNTSGCTGVYWYPKYGCWVAKIGCQRSGPAHIGYFPTFDEAKAAREAAERTLGYADNGRRSRL